MTASQTRAREIAEEAHRGQIKKTGGLVIDHVSRVAARVADDEARTVAWLHDVVEKAPAWTLDRLREEGFPCTILAAVDALTKRPGEEHGDLIRRAAGNPLARQVKCADLEDNLAEALRAGRDGSKYRHGLEILACQRRPE